MKKFDQTLAAIQEVKEDAAGIALLRKALANRSSYLVSKAAQKAEQLGWRELIPDLARAFEHFFEAADQQCWAKIALARALAALEYDEPRLYLRGLRHVQMEPVWGGYQDSGGPLRGQCALALVQCRSLTDLEVLSHLTEVLADSDKTVRLEAARAVASVGRPEGGLLLRLRALSGDSEPEVLGAVFSGILDLDLREGMSFVARFLENGPDVTAEAAMALGLKHEPEALQILRQRFEREALPETRAALLRGIALTRLPEAFTFLLELIRGGGANSHAAREALKCVPIPEEIRNSLPEE